MDSVVEKMKVVHSHNPENWALKLWRYYPIDYNPDNFHSNTSWWLDKIPKLGNEIMEVGTWSGLAIIWLRLNFPEKDIIGLDINLQVVHSAKTRVYYSGLDIPVYLGDGFNLEGFEDKSKDVIFHDGLIEHFTLEERIKLLTEHLRVAKYVLFTLPTKSCYVPNTGYGDELWESKEFWIDFVSNNFIIKKDENNNDEIFEKNGCIGFIIEGVKNGTS